ncbi:hypothetical protein [Vulcanisaeta sp. JCM 16159]
MHRWRHREVIPRAWLPTQGRSILPIREGFREYSTYYSVIKTVA